MNDRMTAIPFEGLMRWALAEQGAVFGVQRAFAAGRGSISIFGEAMETPFGPAAGPHTQLAQNIIAAYVAGARFFELKTVQTLDGEDLPINKPCISAKDEGYNVEWSTELTVAGAMAEYIKAWFALKLLAKERALGAPDGFIFNMSVGYDLEGIRSKKIDGFIEGLRNAEGTDIFAQCRDWALRHIHLFSHVDSAYVKAISPRVCTSITLSTLHGCPADEIERIAEYLLCEKKLHTYIKCNPTLLGYAFARTRLDAMGYDDLAFDDHHFTHDLQYADAAPMLRRLQALAGANGLSFGVKLTNTFPVKNTGSELPGSEMYMSGKPLFGLSTALAARLAKDFAGSLRISYSGGADAHNIAALFQAGIYPITVATTLLKPGGYQRLTQMAELLAACPYPTDEAVRVEAISGIAEEAVADAYYRKPMKPLPSRKNGEKVPLLSCFEAPCTGGCPIHQDIPAYMRCAEAGNYLEALRVIMEHNPLPFITGTICSHPCQSKCRRNFYEEPLRIRGVKLLAAQRASQALLGAMAAPEKSGAKVAVIGGGVGGLAAAAFLARAGMDVTLFEKEATLGGIVRHVIPSFRIDDATIERDVAYIRRLGVRIETNHPVTRLQPLREQGYRYFVVAVGAGLHAPLLLDGEEAMLALDFLAEFRRNAGGMNLGRHVAVIGGGNTAMDTARAAVRVPGVESVTIVYRRDLRSMPADEEEFQATRSEGVAFRPLLSPIRHEGGKLLCEVRRLGARGAGGRRESIATGETTVLLADTVIAAIGQRVDRAFYEQLGMGEDSFLVGDAKSGPGTVVEAISDAREAANAILSREGARKEARLRESGAMDIRAKKGALLFPSTTQAEPERCLACDAICACCVDVCPNRANVALAVRGTTQILHIDRMCNACGNCEAFCPYDSAPYREKFTLFHARKDFDESDAPGLVVLDKESRQCAVRADEDVSALVEALFEDYAYLI